MTNEMTGAEALVRTMQSAGIDTWFANPGTSEMHAVAALDKVSGVRCVLGLFEGVVTGAADGYARMAERPAATLLHLGPGLANSASNLHNARQAASPIVNVVGDHATHHRQYQSPLKSDVEGIARPVSHWVKTTQKVAAVAADAAAAVAEARTGSGRIATLILPADVSWGTGAAPHAMPAIPKRATVEEAAIIRTATKLKRAGRRAALMIGGSALREPGLTLAGRIAAATGCRLMSPFANARIHRGAGRVVVERLSNAVDTALEQLAELSDLVLLGSSVPVAFFAYPGRPSLLAPDACSVHALATVDDDLCDALEQLADATGARSAKPARHDRAAPAASDTLLARIGAAVARSLPEGAIVIDESITSGPPLYAATRCCPPHDWLQNMGGSIGLGLPLATGAAVACPQRKVVCLESDGSGMYALQALWTQAREGLDVTTIILANRSYAVLRRELVKVRAGAAGRTASDMLELDRPALDWAGLARSMGVTAERVTDATEFERVFAAGLAAAGPHLIEVVLS